MFFFVGGGGKAREAEEVEGDKYRQQGDHEGEVRFGGGNPQVFHQGGDYTFAVTAQA